VSDTRKPLRLTFDSAADLYDAARPSYPTELLDDLVDLADLKPGDRLLEIGCATGKATRPLLERGFSVVCVEMGARLAERAPRNLAGFQVEIHVEPFETWGGEPQTFDLVYAATAWHWVDPAIRYSAEEYIALLETFSGHISMEAVKREHLYQEDPTADRPASRSESAASLVRDPPRCSPLGSGAYQ
jgi:SAM-dependent methyltransferase